MLFFYCVDNGAITSLISNCYSIKKNYIVLTFFIEHTKEKRHLQSHLQNAYKITYKVITEFRLYYIFSFIFLHHYLYRHDKKK